TPKVGEQENAPSAVLSTTPGEPRMSSAVPVTASGPGLVAWAEARVERGSEPPARAWWQLPHAIVRVDESCSSQKRVLPRFALAAVTGLPAGCGGAGRGCSGGGGGGCARAMDAGSISTVSGRS